MADGRQNCADGVLAAFEIQYKLIRLHGFVAAAAPNVAAGYVEIRGDSKISPLEAHSALNAGMCSTRLAFCSCGATTRQVLRRTRRRRRTWWRRCWSGARSLQ